MRITFLYVPLCLEKLKTELSFVMTRNTPIIRHFLPEINVISSFGTFDAHVIKRENTKGLCHENFEILSGTVAPTASFAAVAHE